MNEGRQIPKPRPPYGFDCLTCPLLVMTPGQRGGVCHGNPPSATPVGQDANGQLVTQSWYGQAGKGDWCSQHPEIAARLANEVDRIKGRLLAQLIDIPQTEGRA